MNNMKNNSTLFHVAVSVCMVGLSATMVYAQTAQVEPTKPMPETTVGVSRDFMMAGDAEIQYQKISGKHGAYSLADFAPIFLYRANDTTLFEAGFDIKLQNNDSGGGSSTTIDMSFAQLDYLLCDYATLVAGDMLLPLGTYSERSAGWLNKFPDDPLPRGLVPGSGIGAQLRGAFALGEKGGQSLNYAVFAANGPSSVDGTGNSMTTNGTPNLDLAGNVGVNSDGSTTSPHQSSSYGGRLGYFIPVKAHYDLELGLSGQAGDWDNQQNYAWQAGVLDATMHLSPYLEFRGEYISTRQETADVGTLKPHGWWIQGAYKLSSLDLDVPIVNRLELVGRYDESKDGVVTHVNRTSAGVTYYLSSTLTAEVAYEWLSSNDPAQANNEAVLQLAYGF